MYALIDAPTASGKTHVDYCADKGISRAKYNYWQLRRIRERTAYRGPTFIAVAPAPESLSV